MGESIEFPLNFERFMEMGNKAFVADEFTEAEVNFTQAYDLKADFKANRLLVESLLAQSKVVEALVIANEMQSLYLNKVETVKLYLSLLIGNGKFIQSRKLVNQLAHLTDQQALITEIHQSENIFKLYQRQELRQLKGQRQEIPGGTFFQQTQILKNWNQLPLSDYLEVTRDVIESGELNLLLQNSVLADLTELKSQEALTIKSITGDSLSVVPSELPLAEEQLSYQEALIVLATLVENPDSELYQQLKEELRLHFVLLYPHGDELVKEPQLWVAQFLANYLGTETRINSKEKELAKIYQRLQGQITTIIAEMFN